MCYFIDLKILFQVLINLKFYIKIFPLQQVSSVLGPPPEPIDKPNLKEMSFYELPDEIAREFNVSYYESIIYGGLRA